MRRGIRARSVTVAVAAAAASTEQTMYESEVLPLTILYHYLSPVAGFEPRHWPSAFIFHSGRKGERDVRCDCLPVAQATNLKAAAVVGVVVVAVAVFFVSVVQFEL